MCRLGVISITMLLAMYLASAKPEKSLEITMSEPRVVAVAPEEVGWGYYQFPSLEKWSDGTLSLTYNISPDAAESYGKPRAALISNDQGKTWKPMTGKWGVGGLLLPNGDRIAVATPKPYDVARLQLPKPAGILTSSYSKEKYVVYRLQDLPPKLRTIRIIRTKRESEIGRLEHAWLDDPLALRYSLRSIFPIVWWGDMHVLKDGSLIAIVYPGLLTDEDGTPHPKWHVFAYRSTDFGHTWKIQGRILYRPDIKADPRGQERNGFTEPGSLVMDDGSIICVLRTTDGTGIGPMYVTRSSDMGKTWSTPRVIAPNGVLPRLLRLDNGILVLSSGRPGVQLRFCTDGKGLKWSEPFELIPITESNPHADTCGYTSLIATGPDTFLIAYSHFKHENDQGQIRKAILVREVKARYSKQ